MLTLPFWLHNILFFKRGLNWNFRLKKFRTYGHIMHFSPIDSSFTYCSVYIELNSWWKYPIACVAGYQPNAGMKLNIWHHEIFDFTKWAQLRLAKREGWTELHGEKI